MMCSKKEEKQLSIPKNQYQMHAFKQKIGIFYVTYLFKHLKNTSCLFWLMFFERSKKK
jgi:hypothetical protein